MKITDYTIRDELKSAGAVSLFHAQANSGDTPVIIRLSSPADEHFHTIESFHKEQITNLSLADSCSRILKAIEVIDKDDQKGIVHEYFKGITLREFSSQKSLGINDAIQISLGLLEALDAIHRQSIVLKKLTPDNILIDPESLELKIYDLGEAAELNARHTSTKVFNSTTDVQYISPELTGRLQYSVDQRSDYYSLGIILYELVTGTTPYASSNLQEIVHSHIARLPEPPVASTKACPQLLSNIILKLLAKTPFDRYQSSAGIEYDLKHCLEMLDQDTSDIDYQLASQDFSSHFAIPNIFYGRQKELKSLETVIDETISGKGSIVAIKGHAGVGKTAIVQELIQRTSQHILYAHGKFDQFDEGQPYSAFIQIMEGMAKYILSETEYTFNRFNSELQNQLGSNLGVVTNLVPGFLSIIQQPTTPILLGPAETRNRFHDAISTLFSVFTRQGPPLVIFLDDLQWADDASLELLDVLINTDWASNMLLICGYRSDELANAPALEALLTNMKQTSDFKEINMPELAKPDVTSLLADTLHSKKSEIKDLSEFIYSSSQGNILYIRQLLHNMHISRMIWADTTARKWCWNIPSRTEPHNEQDIFSLLGPMIERLGPDQMELLKYGVSMGNNFSLSRLAFVLDTPEEEIIRCAASMVNQSLIFINGDYISFRHDRIQQAVAQSIDEDEAHKIHYEIGKRLMLIDPAAIIGERLLEATNNLNKAEKLLFKEEVDQLLGLNFRSVKYAILSSAYSLAIDYSTTALRLLKKVSPSVRDIYRYDVELEHVRCLYLNARYEEARSKAEELLGRTKTLRQKVECYAVFKDVLVSEGSDFTAAVDIGLNILKQEGIAGLESQKKLNQLLKNKREELTSRMEGKTPGDLFDLKLMVDIDKKDLLNLYTHIWEAAYYDANEPLMNYAILSSVVLSVDHGNASESSFTYALFGMVLTMEGNYREAFDFCELALNLNEKFNDKVMLPKVTNLVCNYVSFYIKPFERSASLYEKSCTTGQENGDNLFGLWAAIFVIWSQFLANKNLLQVLNTVESLRGFIEKTHDTKMIYVLETLESIIGSLIGESQSGEPVSVQDHGEYIEYWQQNHFSPGLTWQAILVGQYYCIEGDFEKAYEVLNNDELVTSAEIIMFPHTQYVYFKTLAMLKLVDAGKLSLTDKHRKIIDANIDTITEWAKNCPDNFLSQQYLLQAELGKIEGKQWDVALLYSKAIDAGTRYNNSSNIAICNEMASEFWNMHGDSHLSEYHLRRSAAVYSNWGAKSKAKTLLSKLATDESVLFSSETRQSSEIGTKFPSPANPTSQFDLYSVAKFTQAISEEVEETNLIDKTMEIILENAGADKGALITVDENNLEVNIIADYFKEEITSQHIFGSLDQIDSLPNHIIHYVQRSENELILNQIGIDETLQDAEYINRHQVKCLCCLPVLYKEKLVAILYLENKSTSGIFNEDQTRILRVILSQLAVSLQNASLYKSLNKEIQHSKNTEAELKISEDRLRLSYQYSNLGVWDWNMITNELYWNENIGPMIGGPGIEIVTSFDNFTAAIHPDDRQKVTDALEKCREGELYQVEHRVLWPDGTIRWILETGDIMRDQDGKHLRMLGVARDITKLKRKEDEQLALQKQLQQAQKMEAIGELTGGIAHDFNNILSAILGFAEIIDVKKDDIQGQELDTYVRKIVSSGKRASELVSQMLSYSRNTDIETSSIDLNAVTEETTNMLHSMMPSSIKLTHEFAEDIPNAQANAVQLNQIIMNLCINARDACGLHGEISINTHYHPTISGTCSSCYSKFDGEYIELSIRDNADGISPEILEDVFTPFFTTKEIGGGSGMGLSMVHGIVHSSAGHIVLESEQGQGTNVRIFMPTAQAYEQTEDEEHSYLQIINSESDLNLHVLVVDDEVAILEIIETVFEDKGWRVTACSSGSEALKLINDGLDNFDIMISDQTMPDVTGVDLSKAALKIDPAFPIILCTGFSAYLDKELANSLGVKELLQKPLSPSSLIQTVERIMLQ